MGANGVVHRVVESSKLTRQPLGYQYGAFYEGVGVDGGGARGLFGGCPKGNEGYEDSCIL